MKVAEVGDIPCLRDGGARDHLVSMQTHHYLKKVVISPNFKVSEYFC